MSGDESRFKNILKHTSIYSIGRFAGKAIGFIMIPLYTNYLTPEDYGIFELLSVLVIVTGIIIQGGISSAVFKFYNKHTDENTRNEVISTIFIFLILFSILFCMILSIFSGEVSFILFGHNNYNNLVVLMLVSFFFSTIASTPETYLMVRKKSKQYAVISFAVLLVSLVLNIYFVAIANMGVYGILYSSILSRIIYATYLIKITIPQIGIKFNVAKLKEVLKFSVPMIPAELGMFIFAFSDRLFLSHMSTLADVGIYSLGHKFAIMIGFLVVQPFMQIWQQEMYEVNNLNNSSEVFGRTYLYLICTVMGFGLLMSIFIQDVIELISSEQFHRAWIVVPVLSLSYLFRASYFFFRMGMFVKSKTGLLSKITCISSFISLAFSYLLIPEYGALGASFSVLFSYAFLSFFTYIESVKLVKVDIYKQSLLKIVVSALILYFLYSNIQLEYRIIGLVVKSTVIPVFLLFIWISGVLTRNEKDKFSKYLSNKFL